MTLKPISRSNCRLSQSLLKFDAVAVDDGVDVGGELALGGLAAVLLLQRARGGIARVDIGWQALRFLLSIQLEEAVFMKQDLAADDQPTWRRRAPVTGMRKGTVRIVLTLAVTSSPNSPLPRVAARVKTPFS